MKRYNGVKRGRREDCKVEFVNEEMQREDRRERKGNKSK